MKAVVLKQKGSPEQAFEIREVEKPDPKAGDVRIEVECFGLNYADVMARNGLYRDAPPMPSIIGYEVVGTIDKVGENVEKSWVGKRVVAFTRFGGYAQYAITPVNGIAEIGDLNGGVASCIATQYVTAYYMAEQSMRFHSGDKVLVHAGAGGVGTALIQLCKARGCEVFSTAGSDEKLKYMMEQGADHVINYRKDDYETQIKKILNGNKLRATFNAIAGSTFKKDMRLIGSGGTVLLFGGAERSGKKWGIFSTLNFVRKMGLIIPIGLMMRSKAVIGINMLKIGDHEAEILSRCLHEVAELVIKGKLKPHVGGAYHANEIDKAHAQLENRSSVGKIVVYWDEERNP